MKKRLTILISFALVVLTICGLFKFSVNESVSDDSRSSLRERINSHPFSKRPRAVLGEKPKAGKRAAPDRAWEQDYLRTMDPTLGRPTPESLLPVMAELNRKGGSSLYLAPGSAQSPWVERGPNNVGGRTRALAWDQNPATPNKVWAGGITGGLWFNNDVTSASSSWNKVNDFWSNIAVSCIAIDPINPQIMYVGTGEGFTAGGLSSARGAGIWKTTDGGSNWTHLSSTANFFWVNDIVVRNEGGASGVVYAAVDGKFHQGDFFGLTEAGIRRSNNGGTSWTNVSPNVPSTTVKFIPADLEIGANNRIWVGTKANTYNASDKGGGRVLYSDNGTTWTSSVKYNVTNGYGRVAIACAPSDSNVVYALVENENQLEAVIKTVNHGGQWTIETEPNDADNGIPATDFTRGQAWYDLVIAVDPNNPNAVIAGGIDLFRSTNGAASWSQISKWSNNNNLAALPCSEVHADQHAIVYKKNSSSTVIFGNDGGVYFTSSVTTSVNSKVISARNKNYNITQFYSCAIHPSTNSNVFLAGSQDNGTQRYNAAGVNATTEVYGGDGGYCFIDQSNATTAIASYVYNNFYRSSNTGQTFPTKIIEDNASGKFINPADYHDADNVLYSAKGAGTIYRIRNITGTPATPETITISGMGDEVSHIRCSPYSSTIFVGTDVGELYRITTANASPASTRISGNSLPAGAISCVEIGANDDELLVTFFNYGTVSVWYTSNGGQSWQNKEGNLPNMPVRWALFNPNDRTEVILATELGVWTTSNLSISSPVWTSSSVGLANTRVDMLQIRQSDQMVIAATHGRGLFSSNAFAAQAPVADFTVSSQTTCVPGKVQFTDASIFDPTTFKWTFTPNTVVFVDGTGDTSRNPRVRFTAAGSYQVSLLATNGVGADTETKLAYISVSATLQPTVQISANANPVCLGSSATFNATPTNGGNAPTYQWRVNGNSVGTNSPTFTSQTLQNGDQVTCDLTSNDSCAMSTPVGSNTIIMQINSLPVVSFNLPESQVCSNASAINLEGGLPLGGTYSGQGVNNNSFNPAGLSVGSYAIEYTYKDQNNCINKAQQAMQVRPIPAEPGITRSGNVLTCSDDAAQYEWYFDGNPIPSSNNKSITMTKSGLYAVVVYNSFGCSASSALFPEFMVNLNTPLQNEWRVYPNPSTGSFVLMGHLPNAGDVHYRIFDAAGSEVFRGAVTSQPGLVEWPINVRLAPGIYHIRLTDNGREWHSQLVIKQP